MWEGLNQVHPQYSGTVELEDLACEGALKPSASRIHDTEWNPRTVLHMALGRAAEINSWRMSNWEPQAGHWSWDFHVLLPTTLGLGGMINSPVWEVLVVVREWTVDNAPAVDSLTYRRSECGKPGSALSFSKSQPQGVKLLSVLHCLRMQLVDFINMLVFVTVLCVCVCVCGTG